MAKDTIPATNQAGEVDVEALVKKALSIATIGTPGQIAMQIATNAVRTTLAALATQPATSQEGEGFLAQLRRVNLARYEAWVEGADAGIMFDALELGGEVGELLNIVKKLEREERGWRGSRANPADFEDECADVLICLDKLARRRNVDLTAATIAKFNATSDKVGLPHRLAATPTPPTLSEDLRELVEMLEATSLDEAANMHDHDAVQIGLATAKCRADLLAALARAQVKA